MSIGGGGFNESSSSPTVVSPFGTLPQSMARQQQANFAKPMTMGFGFGGSPGSPYASGAGPTGTFINQMTGAGGPLASYIPTMTALSSSITGGANSTFGSYQSSVDSFLQQLPGFQSQLGQATSEAGAPLESEPYAKTMAEDAFNPLSSNALFQNQAQQMLSAARPGEAARGLADAGSSAASEQSMIANLASGALQNQQANRAQATGALQQEDTLKQGQAGLLGQLANAGANLASMGPSATSALFSAYPQLASLLQGAAGMPMQAGSDIMQFLQGAENPAMSLLKMILPQVAQKSSSFGMQMPTV